MAKDLWLPKGYELADGSKIHSLLFSGEGWQIFEAQGVGNILVALPELAAKWSDAGLIDEALLGNITFGATSYRSLSSPTKYVLAPVESGNSPVSKVDAIAFAFALQASRKISNDVSFHDAIYVEQYSRLLPTWTLTPHVDDEVVLGTWITGGVAISSASFRRLRSLVGWMSPPDLAEVVAAAGFHVPADVGQLAKSKAKPQQHSEDKTALAASGVQPEPPNAPIPKSAQKTFSLPGRPRLEEFFNEHVIDIIFNADKYQAMGIDFPAAIVLHGPPGCGKTFAVERLVEFIDWPGFSIDSNSVGSPYIHDTSKKISEVFDKAIDAAPSVLVIDEMESFLSDRHSGGTSNLHHVEEVAEFLRRIPEAINHRVLIIAMTNLIELIDPAILRRGRFDHVIEVGMPSRTEVESLLAYLLSRLPKADDLNLSTMLDTLTGKPLSDAAFVVREAARLAAKAGKKQLDQACIHSALASLPEDSKRKSRRIGFFQDS